MAGAQVFGVVGGGIVGLAVARELTRRLPGARVVVFEKEDRVATHQTGHNSGVVHAGLYYKPGSLKAELCARGRVLVREYCEEHRLPFRRCGKLVVAVEASELGRFDALERTATENGVPGLRRVGPGGIEEIEPHAVGLVALHSPETAITDFGVVARAIADEVVAAGGEVRLATEVTRIARTAGAVAVTTAGGVETVDRLVVCAGLRSDRLDAGADVRIVPFRGQYMAVADSKRELVRGMVYPVPDPRYPFLGVHFTRRVSGPLEVGPNAVLALGRDALHTLSWPGFWRLAGQHWRTGATELRGSMSTRAYMRYAQRYVPEIGPHDVVRAGSGVRAQAVERDGSLVDDFRITHADGVTHVVNAPSPAATSCFAIAEHVVDRVEKAG